MAKPTLEHQGLGVYATAHAPGVYEYPDFYGRSPQAHLSSSPPHQPHQMSAPFGSSSGPAPPGADYRNHLNIATPTSALSSSGSSGVFKHFQTPQHGQPADGRYNVLTSSYKVNKHSKPPKNSKSPRYAGNKHGAAKNFNDNFKMAAYAFSGQMPMTPSTAAPSMPDTPFQQRSLQVSRQLTGSASFLEHVWSQADPAEELSVPGFSFPTGGVGGKGFKKSGFLNSSAGGAGGGGVGNGANRGGGNNADSLWSALQNVDWSQRGIPTVINSARFVSFRNGRQAVGRSAVTSAVVQQPIAVDWSAKGLPAVFKVGQPRTDKPSPRLTPKKDLLQIDWSKPGLPVKFSYWERGLLLDWSSGGLPRPHHPTIANMSIVLSEKSPALVRVWKKHPGAASTRFEAMDWSGQGLPKLFSKAVAFFRKSPFAAPSSTSETRNNYSELVLDWNNNGVPYDKIGARACRKAERTRNVLRGNVQGPLFPTTRDGERQWHAAVIAATTGATTTAASTAPARTKMTRMTRRSRFLHRRDVMLKNAFGRQPCVSEASVGDTIQCGHYLFVVASKPEDYQSKAEREREADCCDWSGAGLPANLKDALFDRELAFDWAAAGLPGQFGRDVKRDPFHGQGLVLDWSVRGHLPGEFRRLTHERYARHAVPAVDWSGNGAPYGKRQLKDESALEWHKAGIPPEIRNAQWHLVYGKSFVPCSPKAGSDTKILFKNGFFEDVDAPMVPLVASRGVSRENKDAMANEQVLDAADAAYGGERMDVVVRNKRGRIPYEISVGADTQLRVRDKHLAEPKNHKNVDQLLAEVNDAYHQLHMHRREKAERSRSKEVTTSAEMNPKIVEELLAFNSGCPPPSSDAELRKLSITKRRPVLTPAQRSDRYWSRQLDWSASGLPAAIDRSLLEEDRRGTQGVHKGTNLRSKTRYLSAAGGNKMNMDDEKLSEPKSSNYARARAAGGRDLGAELQIDWAHTGARKMPSQFRHLEPWMHLEGRKHVFDDLQIDWSSAGKTPRQLFELVLEKTRKKDADLLMIDWCARGLPFDFLDQLPTDAELWRKTMQHEDSCRFCNYRKAKQDHRAGGWPSGDLCVDWSTCDYGLPRVKLPGQQEGGCLLAQFADMYEEPVAADFSEKGVPVNVSVFDNLCIDWGQVGALDGSMRITYAVDRAADACGLRYNLRKNRVWGAPVRFETTDTYLWEGGQIHPAVTKKHAVFDKNAKLQNAPQFFRQSIKMLAPKRNQYAQKPEVCYANWAKSGVPLRKTVHKDRAYSIDWGHAGLPFMLESAEFASRGYKFNARCDWGKDGLVMPYEHDFGKVWTPKANALRWVKEKAVPGAVAQMTASSMKTTASAPRGVFYESVDWNSKGLPDAVRAAPFAAPEMRIDWCGAGIPPVVAAVADEFSLPDVPDWSAPGIPTIANLNKRADATWPPTSFTCMDWSWKGLPFAFRRANGLKPDLFPAVDWSRKGLPLQYVDGGRWDPLVLNWATRGLPWGGKPTAAGDGPNVLKGKHKQNFVPILDWSGEGLPMLLHDVGYFADLESENMYSLFSESRQNSKKTYPTADQVEHATADVSYEQLSALRLNGKRAKNKPDSPWNRTKDEIRGVKSAHRLFRTKATKRNLFRVMRREIGCGVALLRSQKQQWLSERRFRMRWEKEVWNGKFENLCDVSVFDQQVEQGFSFPGIESAKNLSSKGSVASSGESLQQQRSGPRGGVQLQQQARGQVREHQHMQKKIRAEGRNRRGRSRGSRERKNAPDKAHTDLRPPHLNEDVLVWHLRKNGRTPYRLALGNEYPNGVHSVSVKASWQQREEKAPLPVSRLLKLCDDLLKKLRDSRGQKGGAVVRGHERKLGEKVAQRLEPKLEHDEETLVYQITRKSRVPFLLTRGKEFYGSSRVIGRKNQPNVEDMLATCAYLLSRPAPGRTTSYVPPGSVMSVWSLRKNGRIPFHLFLGSDALAKATALEESRSPPFSDDLLRQCQQLLRRAELREHTSLMRQKQSRFAASSGFPSLTEEDLLHLVLRRYPKGLITHSDTTLADRGSEGPAPGAHPAERALSMVAESFLRQSAKIFDRAPSLTPNELLAVCAELYPPSCLDLVFSNPQDLRGFTDQEMAKATANLSSEKPPRPADEFAPTLLQDFAEPTAMLFKKNIAEPRGPPPSADDLLRICAELYPPERRTSVLRSAIESFSEQGDSLLNDSIALESGPSSADRSSSQRMVASAKIEYEKAHPRGPPPSADALLRICEELYPPEKRTRVVSAHSLRLESQRAASTYDAGEQTTATLASDVLKNANDEEDVIENDLDAARRGFATDPYAGRMSRISLAHETRKSARTSRGNVVLTTDAAAARKISLGHEMRKSGFAEEPARRSTWSRKSALTDGEVDEIALLLNHATRSAEAGQAEERERAHAPRNTWNFVFPTQPV